MKVKEFLKPFTNTSVFKLRGDLYTAKSIKDLFGDFEIVTADNNHTAGGAVTIVIDEPTCDCYEVTKERRYLTEYEKGYYYGKQGKELTYITEEVSRCLGTMEKDVCSCGGYKSQCNFYREEFMKEFKNDKDN